MADRSRRELEERIDELEATLEELRDELGPRRGPMGVPRPRELLRFTDEYAIPAAIAALEANVRALELLQAGIRATDPDRAADGTGRATRDRAPGVRRSSLDRLDRALSDLEAALEGSGMPGNREALDLLADARRLNEEIRDSVEAGGVSVDRSGSAGDRGFDRDRAIRIDVEPEGESERPAGGSARSQDRSVEDEVESELETVREEVESEERRERDDADGDE